MTSPSIVLCGRNVRLEPLTRDHAAGLTQVSAGDRTLYKWSPVPNGFEEVTSYINTALALQDTRAAVPFAIVRADTNVVIGSTRFWNIERWAWPQHHERHGREFPDACEIGYTWLANSAIRSGANTEAKLLMLEHSFEQWKVLRVCFHTDRRNERSRAALEGIGARFEGVLRAHRMAADFTPRDSCRYSITANEWPAVKEGLRQRLKVRDAISGVR
jgi:RimJ/RimL family protein N-acetyltransferase